MPTPYNTIVYAKFAVLVALMKGESYAAEIVKTVAERTNFDIEIDTSTAQAALVDLCNNGWVNFLPDRTNNLKRAKYYSLSQAGKELAKDYRSAVLKLLEVKEDDSSTEV